MFEEEAERYIKTHNDYMVFALDDADLMQIFKDGAKFGFQKGKKELEEENAKLKAKIEELKKYYEGFEVVFNFKDFMNGGKR